MALVTGRDLLRATAPFDDAATGGEPVVVDPDGTEHRLVRHGGRHAMLLGATPGAGGTPTPARVVFHDPEGGLASGPPGTQRREVLVDGWRVVVALEPAARAGLRDRARRGGVEASSGGPVEVRAIIPGRVLSIAVAAGDAVTAGQQLLVVEAMKMQNEIRAPRDGTVERIAVGPGGTIELGDVLVVLS